MKKGKKILISIIVPVYNVEKYLVECIESIINQTYKNFELILVNDGSKDSSKEICEKYIQQYSNIILIDKENSGASDSRNIGLSKANGDYVIFLDSDDYLDKETLDLCVNEISLFNYDLLTFGYVRFDDNNKLNKKFDIKTEKNLYIQEEIRNILIPNMLSQSNKKKSYNINFSRMFMIRKEYIDSLDWKFLSEKDYESEDVVSMMSLLYNAKNIIILRKNLYYYRYNTMSITNNYKDNFTLRLNNMLEYLVAFDIKNNSNYIKYFYYLYFSYLIIAIKNISKSNFKYQEKINKISELHSNKSILDNVRKYNKYNNTLFRKVFFILFKYKFFRSLYLICKIV